MKREEGYIDVPGGKVWYEILGEGKEIPVLIIHGGPAYPHDYLQPLEKLAQKRKIIFYDQLGCGNSEKPTDKSLWVLERFVEELSIIVETLQLERYSLLGHSWGAMIATLFALNKPKGLTAMILSDPYLSTPLWVKEIKKLLQKFPPDTQKILLEGNPESEEYHEALQTFYGKHLYGISPLPTPIVNAENKINFDIYTYMWGPAEFESTGTLRDVDLTNKLSEITVPVLLLCGKNDTVTPESVTYFQSLLQHAQMKVFEKSAHFPHITETEEYIKTINTFLQPLNE